MDRFEIVWEPDGETTQHSRTALFMKTHGIQSYDDLVTRSGSDPEWFWPAVVEYLGVPFSSPWKTVRDTSRATPGPRGSSGPSSTYPSLVSTHGPPKTPPGWPSAGRGERRPG